MGGWVCGWVGVSSRGVCASPCVGVSVYMRETVSGDGVGIGGGVGVGAEHSDDVARLGN